MEEIGPALALPGTGIPGWRICGKVHKPTSIPLPAHLVKAAQVIVCCETGDPKSMSGP